ncbi:PIN domain-containing protein [Halomontanus rarus]|uniref:PIN domain-containing protein n=1 Tax=Halomontanus rarus TaxID=3034020 RepID=UPI0023E83B21|nr:PIN domain-containing protein [Halovivax sp. TS33]
MSVVILDANAIIVHGQSFSDRARTAVTDGTTLVLPQSVKRELVDDVLETEETARNHRASARAIQNLVDDGVLVLRSPDFETYGSVIDEARRRLADDTLPEHGVKADQYIPALVCELAREKEVLLVTADRKLRSLVRDITTRREVDDNVSLREPPTVL